MPDPFALNQMLARNSGADPDDVLAVKGLLNRFGYYDEPDYGITPYPDGRLFDGIGRFQKDHGLEVDGWMQPGGETEAAMRIVADRGRPGLIDEDFGFPSAEDFRIAGKVGSGLPNREGDVLAAKRVMGALGYYPKRLLLDPIPIVDRELHDGITRFQRDNNLLTDGWMGPGGETATAVREALAARDAEGEQPLGPARPGDRDIQLMSDAGGDEGQIERKSTPGGDRDSGNGGGESTHPQRAPKQNESDPERPQASDILRPSQEPVDIQAMYRQLGYDPQGFLKGERGQFLRDPVRSMKANSLADEAIDITGKEITAGRLPPGDPQNNAADAFRHAYWSYRMTQEIGAEAAKRFGDGHEISHPNDHGERLMDFFNNHVGRQLALDPASKGRPPAEVIREAIERGQLQVTKFRMLQPGIDLERPPRY